MNKPKSRNLLRNLSLGGIVLGLVTQSHAAYADVDAAIDAVEAIPTSATTVFLAAATLGVAFLIIRVVGRALKRGVSL